MKVAKVKTISNVTLVTLKERMDIFNAPLLMKELNQLLDAGATSFIVDLSAVRMVDADGDYPLLYLLRRAQEVGGKVSLVCPIGNPIRVFYEMMHLDMLFDIEATLKQAFIAYELAFE